MRKERIISFANSVLSSIHKIDDNLYKGELRVRSDNPAGIFYLDFTENLNEIEFKARQESVIAADYYDNPGAIQWNYYYLMFPTIIDRAKKKEIESNFKFARKYVLTENEFKAFFELPTTSKGVKKDFVNEIKNLLDKVDLQEVYSINPMKSVFERFKRNDTAKNFESRNFRTVVDIPKINRISQITLQSNYRQFIQEDKVYDFKTVNLITGTNGVGKTSLLESIELIIAGNTYRNPKTKVPDGCIHAILNDKDIDRVQPSQMDKYRLRDEAWYSKSYNRANDMQSSFYRYNYFNADAAFELTHSASESEINEALRNLVLGPEFNYISERIDSFIEHLKPESNKLEVQTLTLITEAAEFERELQKLKISPTFSESEANVRAQLVNSRLKVYDTDILRDFARVDILCTRVLNIFSKIKELSPEVSSLASFHTYSEKLQEKKLAFSFFRAQYDGNVNETNTMLARKNKLQTEIEFYKDCQKYLSHPKFIDLKELAFNFDQIKATAQQVDQVNLLMQEVDILPNESQGGLLELSSIIEAKLSELKRDISKIQQAAINLNEKELDVLLSQIQDYFRGVDYVDVCPVCDNPTSKQKILDNTDKVVSKLKESRASMQHEKLASLNTELKYLERVHKGYFHLRQLAQILYGNFADRNPQKILNDLKALMDLEFSIKQKFTMLDSLNSETKVNNEISLDQLRYLNSRAQNFEITFEQENAAIVTGLLNSCLTEQADLEQKIQNLLVERDHGFQLIKRVLGQDQSVRYKLKELESIVFQEVSVGEELSSLISNLQELVDLDSTTLMGTIEVEVEILRRVISNLRSNTFNTQQVVELTEKIATRRNSIQRNMELSDRYKEALGTLNRLKDNRGGNNLKEFFDQNLSEISQIFSSIHQPKEFKGIRFEKGKLLIDTLNGRSRNITQISTGQRSAIALAIFMTLNRKLTNGPNIIMFDDPIAFIDDLNVLSFVDFLRFSVLQSGSQIFFATANAKLANMFEKKFQYLNDEFMKIEIKRSADLDN